jgi:hypothetical protein
MSDLFQTLGYVRWPELGAGLVLCLFGWTFYWAGLRAVGVGLGGTLGALVGLFIGVTGGWIGWELALTVCGAVVGAILGFFLIKQVHFIVFFLLGALGGVACARVTFALVAGFGPIQESPVAAAWLYHFAVAGLCGLLLAAFSRHLVTVGSGLVGSLLVALSLPPPVGVAVILPVFVTSLAAQFGLVRRFVRREDRASRRRRARRRPPREIYDEGEEEY